MVDKLEEAACSTDVATSTPLLLAYPTLPSVLFTLKVPLPLLITLDSTNAIPEN